MIKRLIFDVDNTLLVNVDFKKTIRITLKQFNIYSEKTVQDFSNSLPSYNDLYENYNSYDFVNHIEERINQRLPKYFLEKYIDNLIKYAVPEKNPKLIQTITNLSKKYDLVLLTNFFAKSQIGRLETFGIGKYFSQCYGENLIKPHINAFLNACGPYKPNECIMIGDSVRLDIEPARKVGMHTILVNTKNEPIDNIDTVVVSKVEDIDEDSIKRSLTI